MKIFSSKNIVSVIFSLTLASASAFSLTAQAATISNNPLSDVGAKDVFVIDILLDTEGESINTVDGTIKLSSPLAVTEVRDISVAGSAVSLWPRKPSLSEKGDVISFAGGIPGGVVGKAIPLFKVIVSVNRESELKIQASDIKAYVNDGKGTALDVVAKFSPVSIGIAKAVPVDSWKENISSDNTPPEPFEIKLLQDKSIYSNNLYISYGTIDKDSGVSHYEVKEGRREPVRAGETYVLIDQSVKTNITVTAYDKAGNARTVAFSPESKKINWLSILVTVLVVVVGVKIVRIWIKNRRHGKDV